MNQAPGLPRFAKIEMEKQKMLNSLEEAPQVQVVGEKLVDANPAKILEVDNSGVSNKSESNETPVKKEKKKQSDDVVTMSKSDFEMLQENLLKKVQESIDPNVYKRHPKFKGPRVARTFHIETKLDAWLNSIYDEKGIEKTTVVTEALKKYLSENYKELEP